VSANTCAPAADVADVLATIVPQVRARFARAGWEADGGADACGKAEPGLVGLAAAAMYGVLAVGGSSGAGRSGWGHGEAWTAPAAAIGGAGREPGAGAPLLSGNES